MSSTDESYVDAVATDIVVAATEINNNADSDSDDEVEIEACSTRRVAWPKINLTVRKNGKSFDTHPFLDDRVNERDRAFVRILLEERPYSAGYGEVGATWATIMQKCNDLRDEKGKKLFIPDLQEVTTVQTRLKNYISFIKKHQQNVPLRSGCDDEKPSDLLLLLYELKEDCRVGVEESKKRRDQRRFLATKKEIGRAAAIKLKDKSVKKLELKAVQGDETDVISSSDVDVECRFQKKTKTTTVHSSIQKIADIGKSRADAKAAAVVQKEKAASTKEKYMQWKMDEAALDREQAALERAQKAELMAIRKTEADNRKMELQLKMSKRKHDKNETDSSDDE
jgi:hypothetical protein